MAGTLTPAQIDYGNNDNKKVLHIPASLMSRASQWGSLMSFQDTRLRALGPQ